MTDRPLGMRLVCGFFGLMGVVLPPSAIVAGGWESPPDAPQSVHLLITFLPLFVLLMGILGMVAAVTLWRASPVGRLSGLLWAALWAAEEITVGIWIVTGPEIIQQTSVNVGLFLLRALIAGILFYYLWADGAAYIEANRTDTAAPPSANGA